MTVLYQLTTASTPLTPVLMGGFAQVIVMEGRSVEKGGVGLETNLIERSLAINFMEAMAG